MKPYKASQVLGKMKASHQRMSRMLLDNGMPDGVQSHIKAAQKAMTKAIEEWERLAIKKKQAN